MSLIVSWTLIIMVLSGSGRAVDHIDGFKSLEECQQAAAVLERASSRYVDMACVKKTV